METESRRGAGGGGRGRELVFNGYRVSVLEDETFLEIDRVDSCITL